MTPSFDQLSFVVVAAASAITGAIGALRARKRALSRAAASEAEPEPGYDLGRWHEQERQDRVLQAMRLHHDLERLEKVLERQTQVVERALDRLPDRIVRAQTERPSEGPF